MSVQYTGSVVGGGLGGQLSMHALHASDRYRLVAAADLREDVRGALKQEYPDLQVFASAREMFAACPTDVVCVATYPPSHLEVALDALELPLKGILVEKPLADTAASGARLLDAIRSRNLPMAVPHGLMALPHSLRILQHIREGDIGRMTLMEIECGGWDIINSGIHWLNFFVAAAGDDPMESVLALCDASTRTWRDGMQVETEAITYVVTKGGTRAALHTGDEVRTVRESDRMLFRIVGDRGLIEFPGWKHEYRLLNESCPEGKTVKVDFGPKRPHQTHLDALADQMDDGRTDYSIAESSLTALELCEAAYLSHRHRCKVTFPLREFQPPEPTDWDPGRPYSGVGGGRDGRQFA